MSRPGRLARGKRVAFKRKRLVFLEHFQVDTPGLYLVQVRVEGGHDDSCSFDLSELGSDLLDLVFGNLNGVF